MTIFAKYCVQWNVVLSFVLLLKCFWSFESSRQPMDYTVKYGSRMAQYHQNLHSSAIPISYLYMYYFQLAIPTADGPRGEVWTTYGTVSSESTFVNRSYGIIFAANLSEPYTLHAKDMGLPDSVSLFSFYKWREKLISNNQFSLQIKWSKLNKKQQIKRYSQTMFKFYLVSLTVIVIHIYEFDFEKDNVTMRKRKRSDSVLWQKPIHQQKCQKGKVTT